MTPRVVIVSRPSRWAMLLRRYGTEGQLRFILKGRGEDPEVLLRWHHARLGAIHAALAAIPLAWRRAQVDRADLDRFLFEPSDLVVSVGPDGLVANVAKYLSGQPVLGVMDSPELSAGVLAVHPAGAVADHLADLAAQRSTLEARTMVEAVLSDGQRLLALNEIFVGHRSHQSARYRLRFQGEEERQSSSGLLVASGTGATGWVASVHRNRQTTVTLPTPTEERVVYFVREAWPSAMTGTSLTDGEVSASEEPLVITSEMEEGGVVFADGIEADHLVLEAGVAVRLGVAAERLWLVPG